MIQKRYSKKGYKIEVDDRNLIEGIKYAIAMEKIVNAENINIFCINDIIEEMHSVTGLRPSLYNPRLSESGVVVAMEADIQVVSECIFLKCLQVRFRFLQRY